MTPKTSCRLYIVYKSTTTARPFKKCPQFKSEHRTPSHDAPCPIHESDPLFTASAGKKCLLAGRQPVVWRSSSLARKQHHIATPATLKISSPLFALPHPERALVRDRPPPGGRRGTSNRALTTSLPWIHSETPQFDRDNAQGQTQQEITTPEEIRTYGFFVLRTTEQ